MPKLDIKAEEAQLVAQKIFAAAKLEEELKATVDGVRMLQNELIGGIEIMIPMITDYLGKVREVRMAFGREIQDILRSARELTELSKSSKEIGDFIQQIIKLGQVLTDENIEKLRRVLK